MQRVTTTILITLLTVAAAAPARAHDGHEHRIMGTVTAAATDQLTLEDTTGKAVTVVVTKDTRVTRGKDPMKAEAIAPGTRVVVTAVTDKNRTTARAIQVAPGQ